MAAAELQAELEAVERDGALYDEAQFALRAERLDYLEVHILGRAEALLRAAPRSAELRRLRRRAQRAVRRLERVDASLFRRLRAEIRSGRGAWPHFAGMVGRYVALSAADAGPEAHPGYDTLDAFISGLLRCDDPPAEAAPLDPEMVGYHATPARVVFELVERARPGGGDVFYDLGSGLGKVVTLVHLLSGAPARGVEADALLCGYAARCAGALGLSAVEFHHTDARSADYAGGTIFFMYTPFRGRMLEQVLERLREGARGRRVRLFTYGPCTEAVARQGWLACEDPQGCAADRLAAFTSDGI